MKKTIIIWGVGSVCLILLIFYWIHYLIKNNFIVECFITYNADKGLPDTSHNVDQPLNNIYTCQNMCGSQSRCILTGEQCTSDVDCQGCRPPVNYKQQNTANVVGENDAGKVGPSITFSELTTDFASEQAKIIDKSAYPSMYARGEDMWTAAFNDGLNLHKSKYDKTLPNEIKYNKQTSLSGDYTTTGPSPSNAWLK
jgi:hypothetical protein